MKIITSAGFVQYLILIMEITKSISRSKVIKINPTFLKCRLGLIFFHIMGSNPHSYWAIRLWGFEFWDSTRYLNSHIKEIRAIGQINPLRIS